MIVEDPLRGVVVPGLSEVVIENPSSLQQIVVLGNQRRMMAATGANQFSSRSHSILIVSVESQAPNSRGEVVYSKLQMIDLAGSERAAQTENRGQRMVEGANINRSLLALGNCINILSDNMRPAGTFVPYRDSKLTRLLKDSLGGNTKTVMIACVSPSAQAFEESVNTLKYASRARNIKKKVDKNLKQLLPEESPDVVLYKETIAKLNYQIENLKA
jgi:kinesin family protein 18/19